MLYKTRHQLIESLNENGLYTAKCYNEILAGSPLTSVVAPGGGKYQNNNHDNNNEAAKDESVDTSDSNEEEEEEEDTSAPFDENSHDENRWSIPPASKEPANNNKPKTFGEKLESIGQPTRHHDDDDIDVTSYPDTGVMRGENNRQSRHVLPDPDEGSKIDERLSKNIPRQEPEGVKTSRLMSVGASAVSRLASASSSALSDERRMEEDSGDDVVPIGREQKKGMDPPSSHSIASSGGGSNSNNNDDGGDTNGRNYHRRDSHDPPPSSSSPKKYPEDETSVERNPNHWDNDDNSNSNNDSMGVANNNNDGSDGGVNVIVDDDEDSFINGIVVQQEEEIMVEENKTKKEDNEFATNFDEGKLTKEIEKNLPLIVDPEPTAANVSSDMDSQSSTSEGASNYGESKEYLNISIIDGEVVALKGSPNAPPKPRPAPPVPPQTKTSLTVMSSYFDIHKSAYKEMNSKLAEHSNLVQYVEHWMDTISTRIQTKYAEYCKNRTSLNHYFTKFNSLLHEEQKLREKNKAMKPKQIDKLERNQAKLASARELHDNSAENLLMLMEEVILRSWHDAFPLLQKSIGFEVDFSNIMHKHMVQLGPMQAVLDVIREKESIEVDGRLESLKSANPGDIYTGSRERLFAKRC